LQSRRQFLAEQQYVRNSRGFAKGEEKRTHWTIDEEDEQQALCWHEPFICLGTYVAL
jgi:hypothetical protein